MQCSLVSLLADHQSKLLKSLDGISGFCTAKGRISCMQPAVVADKSFRTDGDVLRGVGQPRIAPSLQLFVGICRRTGVVAVCAVAGTNIRSIGRCLLSTCVAPGREEE
jgi:hypothetical protein